MNKATISAKTYAKSDLKDQLSFAFFMMMGMCMMMYVSSAFLIS